MKSRLVLFSILLSLPSLQPCWAAKNKPSHETPPLFKALQNLEDLQTITPESFEKQHEDFDFQWLSSAQKNESHSSYNLSFFGHTLYEAAVRFKENKLNEVELLFFNRGDARENLAEPDFETLKKNLDLALEQMMKVKGVDAWVAGNAADIKRKSWFKAPLRADLETSASRNALENTSKGVQKKIHFRPEFIRIIFTPYDGKQSPSDLIRPNFTSSGRVTALKQRELKQFITHETNGDVYLKGIPMVDQGQKGYCAVASAERVMRFYGLNIDQNELAKAANASKTGTAPDEMIKCLRKIGSQFSINLSELKKFDIRNFMRTLDKQIADYNRIAKTQNKAVIKWPPVSIAPREEIYMETYANMDHEILKQVRQQKDAEKTKFMNDLTIQTENGIPVLWTVVLGFVDEVPETPQNAGGHMRLLIGYNKKKDEVIYTDSWGDGHELKHMSLDEAFAITTGLYSMLPQS